MMQQINRYRTITIKPHWGLFVINESPLLAVCPLCIIYAGVDGAPFGRLALVMGLLLSLHLLYRFVYLKRMKYDIGSEQIVFTYGVLQRRVNYLELYRIVDFDEHQSLMQQLVGLKTVSIYSGDRTTPKLDIIGVKNRCEYVAVIRERVEYNKQRKGIYEITNR